MELRLRTDKSLWENLGEYHERLKKLRRKLRRIEELLSKEEEAEEEKKIVLVRRRERDWYERFRWTFTRNGLLVLGGKDAKTNEQLVRRYLEPGDLFFHADIARAPAVVLKGGKDAKEEDILDAAVFSASYSRAWREGFSSIDVFYVPAEQVSLSPPSGEYRPKGGVMVYGKKRWMRKVPLRLYVGFDEEKGRFFVSPFEVPGSVLVLPGRREKPDVAREILRMFGKGKEFYDDLMALLPPGGCELKGH